MAVDLTSLPPGQIYNLTTGDADKVTKVSIRARFVTFEPRLNACKVSYGNAAIVAALGDNSLIGSAHYKSIPAGVPTTLDFEDHVGPEGTVILYVTSATTLSVIEIDTEGKL